MLCGCSSSQQDRFLYFDVLAPKAFNLNERAVHPFRDESKTFNHLIVLSVCFHRVDGFPFRAQAFDRLGVIAPASLATLLNDCVYQTIINRRVD